jgi:large subunit ribosomal protein L3
MRGLIGRKIGMTQIFGPDGRHFPVTVIQVGPNVVVQKKAAAGRDKYSAVKLGFEAARKSEKEGTAPRWRMTKPMLGVFQKAGIETPLRHLRELRLDSDAELARYEVGAQVGATEFQAGQYVDVIGTSKGRGFTGVMKRHNFSGSASSTHGTHEYFRHAGSIGSSAWPSRVIRGKRMEGQHGNSRATLQNLHVVEVMAEENVILVKGGVPGPNGGLVFIRTAVKRPKSFKLPWVAVEPQV